MHGSGVTAIPFLAGGTLNDARAVSPDGNLVLLTGNSAANPNGEAYLYTASTGGDPGARIPERGMEPGPALVRDRTAGVRHRPYRRRDDGRRFGRRHVVLQRL